MTAQRLREAASIETVTGADPRPAHAGRAMDRQIQRPKQRWRSALGVAMAATLVAAGWRLSRSGGERTLAVARDHLMVATVTRGVFEDFIPIRARVTPLETIFLDAIEGGRVERVMVEDGDTVGAGHELVELSNTSLQLDVIARETAVAEQLNNTRSLELALERNRQAHASRLVDLDFEITRLGRVAERQRRLHDEGVGSRSDLIDAEDELAHYRNRRAVAHANQEADLRLQGEQLVHLRAAASQLVGNLDLARRNLDGLVVRAPMAGRLSGFEVEVGQSVAPGGRLGQIDAPDRFKLTAGVDEFYLGRVQPGQRATYSGDRDYTLEVERIRPQVEGGQFGVDLVFVDAAPPAIRRGQTLQLRLTLGDSREATLVANGAFLAESGGGWVFVVSADGAEARRQAVRTGRRNPSVVEVLAGLEPGERIVTSSYAGLGDIDRLAINGN